MTTKETPEPQNHIADVGKMVDVDALKREVVSASHFQDEKSYGCSSGNSYVKTFDAGIVLAIDHLASAGYLRAPLPKIEGLEDAISFFGEQYTIRTMSKDEADHRGKIWKAALAYLKASEGV